MIFIRIVCSNNIIFLLLLLSGHFNNIFSQNTIYTSNIDSIIVQIGRQSSVIELLPYSISKLDSSTLTNTANKLTIKDLFNTVPGVFVSNRFNLSQGDKITIRGIGSRAQFGVRGIKILLDDIPLTFPDGQSQLNNLDIGLLGQIEVLRGPSSALYGNSSGGIISMKSRDHSDKKFNIRTNLNGGSFGFYKFSFGASGKLFNGGASIDFYTAKYDGFRDHSNSKFSGINFITSQHFSENFQMSAVVNYYNAPYLLNPGSLNSSVAKLNPQMVRERMSNSGTGKSVKQFQTGISFKYSFSDYTNIKSTFYGIHRSLFNGIPTRLIDLQRYSYGIRSVLSYYPKIFNSRIKILAGIDNEIQDDTRREFVNQGIVNYPSIKVEDIIDELTYGKQILDQNEFVNSFGAFSNIQINPFENIWLNAGLRYDNFVFRVEDNYFEDGYNDSGHRNMNSLSPIFGISIKFPDMFVLYGNYSSAFQTPTTNELSNTEDGSGGFNASLKPEKIGSIEAGIRGTIDALKLQYNLVYYHMNIKDMLVPYQNVDEENYYRNSGKSENNGLEFSIKIKPLESIVADMSYSSNKMKFRDYKIQRGTEFIQLAGNYVPGVPEYVWNFGLASYLPFGFFAKINFNSVGKIYTNDFNGPPPNSSEIIDDFINEHYMIANMIISYSADINYVQLNFRFGIDNMFDKRYNGSIVPNAFGNNFYEPASGRAFYAGIKLII